MSDENHLNPACGFWFLAAAASSLEAPPSASTPEENSKQFAATPHRGDDHMELWIMTMLRTEKLVRWGVTLMLPEHNRRDTSKKS